jgi:hypothetical protein
MDEKGAEKRKYLEGLSAKPGKMKYYPPAHKNQQLIYKEWKPASGVNLEKDHIIVFNLKTGPDELIR